MQFPNAATILVTCLAGTSVAASSSSRGSAVVRRGGGWISTRNAALIEQAELAKIDKQIITSLNTTISLLNQVSKDEPEIKDKFDDIVVYLQTFAEAIDSGLQALRKS